MNVKRTSLSILSIGLGLGLVFGLISLAAAASQIDISGPPGSGNFGAAVTVLPNGNILVTDPHYDAGGVADVGAVYLYDGASGMLISKLTGSTAGDRVGSNGVMILANGNYLVRSPYWDNGTATDAGAVTWGDGTTGVTGTVRATNSLVGSTADEWIGYYDINELSNSNYVVSNRNWDNGGTEDVGAVTWGDGDNGVTGTISAANSLVGSTAGDQIGGYTDITALANGNYVVSSPYWDNGAAADAGAVTWGDGTNGVTGTVSAANSLVGSMADDLVGGYPGITALANGNYVVASQYWDNGVIDDAGAVTWGNGASGVSGDVSTANSLVGSTAGDSIGSYGITALANGNYVVSSPWWNNGAEWGAGAVTWGDGTIGVAGAVSAANSLVGSTIGDEIGSVRALANGNYVVSSPYWDNGTAADAGAVTWGDGTSGVTGAVSAANSLVGSTANDLVGTYDITALANGNYVVSSPYWDNGTAADAGAVTWGDGTSGVTGAVSAANSLVGSTNLDQVGYSHYIAIHALANGNYVVRSPYWDNGTAADAGAVTWGDGGAGTIGPIIANNSVRGYASSGGSYLKYAYDSLNQQLVVGRPWDNIVTLFRLNDPPVANAGPDQTVKSSSTVTLDGSASHDPDNNLLLVYGWMQSGGAAVTLSSTSVVSPTFTAPAIVAQTSILTFTLVVTDTLGLSSLPDQVVIFVEPYAVLLPVISNRVLP